MSRDWRPWPPEYPGRSQWMWVRTVDRGGWPDVTMLRLERHIRPSESFRYVLAISDYRQGLRTDKPEPPEGTLLLLDPDIMKHVTLDHYGRRATHYMFVDRPRGDSDE